MSIRILRYVLLLALMLAPLGRLSVAEAKAVPHHEMSMMASHCPDPSPADGNKGGGMSVDCMIACAAVVASPATALMPPVAVEAAVASFPLPMLAGIRPEAEPPPPRLS